MRLFLTVLGVLLFAGVSLATQEGVRSLAKGQHSDRTKQGAVVARDADSFTRLWNGLQAGGQPGRAPAVDFKQEMVIAVFLGQKPTGGYAVEVTGVRQKGKRLVVEARVRQPDPGGFVTQALTQPYELVAVKRSNLPVSLNLTPAPAKR